MLNKMVSMLNIVLAKYLQVSIVTVSQQSLTQQQAGLWTLRLV